MLQDLLNRVDEWVAINHVQVNHPAYSDPNAEPNNDFDYKKFIVFVLAWLTIWTTLSVAVSSVVLFTLTVGAPLIAIYMVGFVWLSLSLKSVK